MKRIIFLSFAALFFAAAANAQKADTSGIAKHKKAWHKYDNKNREFYKKLNLSDDQRAQIKAVNQDQKSAIETIQNNSSLTDTQKKAQIKATRTEAYKKRQAIYTPEQKAVIKEDYQKHKWHRVGKKHAPRDSTSSNNSNSN